MRVQFRSVSDTTRTVDVNGCSDTGIFPYTEVFFKSINGEPVVIDCGPGSCSSNLAEEPSEIFSEEDVSTDMRDKCLQIAEVMRNGDYDGQEDSD
jgi:hypothetical protein